MPPSAGYFYRDPVLPVSAFYVLNDNKTAFRFTVQIYKTKAQALAMYNRYDQHVRDIGGNFHAFKMIQFWACDLHGRLGSGSRSKRPCRSPAGLSLAHRLGKRAALGLARPWARPGPSFRRRSA